jgi:hypothetical protein
VGVLAATGCMYSFAGGGLPPHIHTMAIATFENQTASPDIPKELYDRMHSELQRRLGVRDAPSDRADALAHGIITLYDVDVPVSFSANPLTSVSARRRLAITLDVEIVDQSNSHVLFAQKTLREEADYAEGAELAGRTKAIEKLVQRMIEGVQSNW